MTLTLNQVITCVIYNYFLLMAARGRPHLGQCGMQLPKLRWRLDLWWWSLRCRPRSTSTPLSSDFAMAFGSPSWSRHRPRCLASTTTAFFTTFSFSIFPYAHSSSPVSLPVFSTVRRRHRRSEVAICARELILITSHLLDHGSTELGKDGVGPGFRV